MGTYNATVTMGIGVFYSDEWNKLAEEQRKYVNDQLLEGDIGTIGGENVSRGSYNVINNSHTFETGGIAANAQLYRINNYCYQTSTTKNNSQTASIQWQDIADSGCTLSTAGGTAVISAYLYYFISQNPTVHTATNDGPGNGLWYNQIVLRYRNHTTGQVGTLTTQTDNYCFNGFGSVVDTLDPGEGDRMAQQRPIQVNWSIVLSAGDYSFTMAVNPHNEVGKAVARSMTVEVFDL